MANYPLEHAQDAAYQSHTGCLTGLRFLPKLALGLNTNNKKITSIYAQVFQWSFVEDISVSEREVLCVCIV
jgi:hypothetical protein